MAHRNLRFFAIWQRWKMSVLFGKTQLTVPIKLIVRVVTDSEEDPVFEKKRKVIMHELCNLSRRTVEWFEPTDEGMVLRDRISPPESVVSAKVSVGSVFVWGESPGAVRLLAGSRYFTGKPATDIESRKYVSHGVAVPITPAESHERMQDVKKKKVLADEFCNPHGTRRIAAVVEKSGKFIGILSIIEVVLHPNVAENRDYLPALEKQAEMLSS